MQGFYDFPQEVRGSLFEEEKYITSLAIIVLGILFIYGTYSIITWCAGPRLEDLFRGYVPLTGKQRRHRQRESDKPSIKSILKNNFLLLWRRLILIFKRTKNQLWRFCNPIGKIFLQEFIRLRQEMVSMLTKSNCFYQKMPMATEEEKY